MSHFAERVRQRANAKQDEEESKKHPMRQKVLGFELSSTRVHVNRAPYHEPVVVKPNYTTDCVVCNRRNKMTAKRCHFCKVNNAVMSGDVTTTYLASRAHNHHVSAIEALVNGVANEELFGWLDKAQLIIQGIRVSQVDHMYQRFRAVFNTTNGIQFLERPAKELIALLPPETFESDDFTLHVVHAALEAFLTLDEQSESLNVYDLLGGIAIFCSQDPLLERFKFLCKLYAFDDGEDEVSEDEFTIMMSSIVRAMQSLQLLVGVSDDEVDAVCGEAFLTPLGESRTSIGAEDLVELTQSHEVLRDLVRTVEFFPRLLTVVTSLLKRQERLVESIAEGEKQLMHDVAQKAVLQQRNEEVTNSIVVGPWLGTVTSRSAVVVLEMDSNVELTCRVVVETASADPQFAPETSEKLCLVIHQQFAAFQPERFVIENLQPANRYKFVLCIRGQPIGSPLKVVTLPETPSSSAQEKRAHFIVVGPHAIVHHGNSVTGSEGHAPFGSGPRFSHRIFQQLEDIARHRWMCPPQQAVSVKLFAVPFDLVGMLTEVSALINGNDVLSRMFETTFRRALSSDEVLRQRRKSADFLLMDVPTTVFSELLQTTLLGKMVQKVVLKRFRRDVHGTSFGEMARKLPLDIVSYRYLIQSAISQIDLPALGASRTRRILLWFLEQLVIGVGESYFGKLTMDGVLAQPHESQQKVDPENPTLLVSKRRQRKMREKPWVSPLVGCRISVRFESGKKYFATIVDYDSKHSEQVYDEELHKKVPKLRPYKVKYDDGEVEWLIVSDVDVQVFDTIAAATKITALLRSAKAKQAVAFARRYNSPHGHATHCAVRLQRWFRRRRRRRHHQTIEIWNNSSKPSSALASLQAVIRGKITRRTLSENRQRTAALRIQSWLRGERGRHKSGHRIRISGSFGQYGRKASREGSNPEKATVALLQRLQLAFQRSLDNAQPMFASAFTIEFDCWAQQVVTLKVQTSVLGLLACFDASAAARRTSDGNNKAEVASSSSQQRGNKVILESLPSRKLMESDWQVLRNALKTLSRSAGPRLCRQMLLLSDIPVVSPHNSEVEAELVRTASRFYLNGDDAVPRDHFFRDLVAVPLLDVLFGWQQAGRRQSKRSTADQAVPLVRNQRSVFLMSSWSSATCGIDCHIRHGSLGQQSDGEVDDDCSIVGHVQAPIDGSQNSLSVLSEPTSQINDYLVATYSMNPAGLDRSLIWVNSMLPENSEHAESTPASPQRIPRPCIGLERHCVATEPSVVLGPIVGRVTPHSAITLLQLDADGLVSVVLRDVLTGYSVSRTQMMQQDVPEAFLFCKLKPGRQYILLVNGVSNSTECFGRVSTPFTSTTAMRIVAVSNNLGCGRISQNQNNLLQRIRNRCRSSPWHRPLSIAANHEPTSVDIVLHLGGQVSFLRTAMREATATLESFRTCDLTAAEEQEMMGAIKQSLRSAYVNTWRTPYWRWVLANTSNIMLWGFNDLGGNDSGDKIDPLVVRIAIQLCAEYQHQLWDPLGQAEMLNNGVNGASFAHFVEMGTSTSYFHRYGELGILCLDTKSASISKISDRLFGNEEWHEIEAILQPSVRKSPAAGSNTIIAECDILVIVSPMLVISDVPEAAAAKRRAGAAAFSAGNSNQGVAPTTWACYPDELEHLLDLCFAWAERAPSRSVLFLCDGSFIGGLESEIMLDARTNALPGAQTKTVIRQVAIGPVTDNGDALLTSTSRDKSVHRLRAARTQAILADSSNSSSGYVSMCDGKYKFRHHECFGFGAAGPNFSRWTPNFADLRIVYDKRAIRLASELRAEQHRQGRAVAPEAIMDTLTATIVHAQQPPASIILGPVIGLTTHSSTVILIEVDNDADITVVLEDRLSGATLRQTLALRAQRPRGFQFSSLLPQRQYSVFTEGATNSTDDRFQGRLCTTARCPPRLRLACVSNDDPSSHNAHWWDRIYDSYLDHDHRVDNGVDMLIHCGGQVLTGDSFSQHDVSSMRGSHAKVKDPFYRKHAEDRLRDQVREMYRASWNIPARKRVLAHIPSLMIWGPQEVFTSDHIATKESTPTCAALNRIYRDVYWEYQRQLWIPQFGGKGGTDEFHFHRWGRVGILFIDVLGNRFGADGTFDDSCDMIGPQQLRFLHEHVLASEGLLTIIVVAPCAPARLPVEVVQPLIRWKNHAPVPAPQHFARQLLFLGGGRRARKARVGMFVPTPPTAMAPTISVPHQQHFEGGSAFLLATGNVAGKPREISYGMIQTQANLHSAWVDRWTEPARTESEKAIVTLGPIIGALDATSVVVLIEADKPSPKVRATLIDVITSSQHPSSQVSIEANRPKAFRVTGLKPGRRYIVYLEGVACPKDRRAYVTTPPADPEELSIIAVAGDRAHELNHGDEDHWHTLSNLIDAPGALPSVLLHLGGQVTMTRAFHETRHWLEAKLRELSDVYAEQIANGAVEAQKKIHPNDVLLPRNIAAVDKAILHFEDIARERLREEYRESWNLPSKRYLMARCPSMMVLGALDICKGFDGLFVEEQLADTTGAPPETTRVLRLALEVFGEYQLQLADPAYASKLNKGTNEFFQFRRVGYIGILTLDCRGNRLHRDGSRHHDNPILGSSQWKFIEKVLEEDAGDAVFLAVGVEQPPALMTRDELLGKSLADPTAADIDEAEGIGIPGRKPAQETKQRKPDIESKLDGVDVSGEAKKRRLFLQSQWAMKEEDLEKFLEALFLWENATPQRKVVLVCGGVGFGLNSIISSGKTKIAQITVGPITDSIDRVAHSMSGRYGRFNYKHNRLTRDTRSKRTIAIVRAVVKNEVGFQEKLAKDAEDIAAKERAAAKSGEEVEYPEPKFVTAIRDQMLAKSVPFNLAVKGQHRVEVSKNVEVTTNFLSDVKEVLAVQVANLRTELMMAQVDEVVPSANPYGMETDSQGRLGNEYAQWWARTGALSRCPILPHPTLEWSDNLRKKAKRPMNRFALDMTLRPFQELLKGVHAKFLAGDLDFNESLVAVWQKCDAKMRASMAHLPDPFVQRYCIERLQADSLDPPMSFDDFTARIEEAIGNAICMKVAFEMDEEAEVQIATSIEAFEAAKDDHRRKMEEREQKLKEREEKRAKKRRDQERKQKLREELQESLSRQL